MAAKERTMAAKAITVWRINNQQVAAISAGLSSRSVSTLGRASVTRKLLIAGRFVPYKLLVVNIFCAT
jgi:hypothetical protein